MSFVKYSTSFEKYSMSIFKNSCSIGKKTMPHKNKVLLRCNLTYTYDTLEMPMHKGLEAREVCKGLLPSTSPNITSSVAMC